MYEFADPALEDLSAGQKILVRTGLENERRIKVKLRDIRQGPYRTSRRLRSYVAVSPATRATIAAVSPCIGAAPNAPPAERVEREPRGAERIGHRRRRVAQ